MQRQINGLRANTRTTSANCGRRATSWSRRRDGPRARIRRMRSVSCCRTRCAKLGRKMRNPSSSLRIREHVLDLVWSLWAEMGVSSWTRRHAHWAVDPEPLILITSAPVAADPRLRDESIDWCIQYGRYVSVTRLKNLLRDEPEVIRHAFATYAAVVNAHSALCWPSQAKAAEYHPTGRSSVSSFASPALIGLRLR